MVRLSILYIPFVWGETEGKQTASHSPLYSQRTPPQSWTQSPLAVFHAGPIYYELEQWSYGFLSFLAHFQRKYLYRFADKPLETASVQLALKCNEPPPPTSPSTTTALSFPSLVQAHSCGTEWLYSFIPYHQHSRSSVFTSVGGFLWGDCYHGNVQWELLCREEWALKDCYDVLLSNPKAPIRSE